MDYDVKVCVASIRKVSQAFFTLGVLILLLPCRKISLSVLAIALLCACGKMGDFAKRLQPPTVTAVRNSHGFTVYNLYGDNKWDKTMIPWGVCLSMIMANGICPKVAISFMRLTLVNSIPRVFIAVDDKFTEQKSVVFIQTKLLLDRITRRFQRPYAKGQPAWKALRDQESLNMLLFWRHSLIAAPDIFVQFFHGRKHMNQLMVRPWYDRWTLPGRPGISTMLWGGKFVPFKGGFSSQQRSNFQTSLLNELKAQPLDHALLVHARANRSTMFKHLTPTEGKWSLDNSEDPEYFCTAPVLYAAASGRPIILPVTGSGNSWMGIHLCYFEPSYDERRQWPSKLLRSTTTTELDALRNCRWPPICHDNTEIDAYVKKWKHEFEAMSRLLFSILRKYADGELNW